MGQHDFEKVISREEKSKNNYIWGQKGYKDSGHLSAPTEDAVARKVKRLGHFKEKKLVGWDLQKPRDNKMYYIGEGGNNLKKMDKHIKRKQGNILNLFSKHVINDQTLNKMKKQKVKVLSSSVSMAASQASHSTAESANVPNLSSEFTGANDTNKLFNFNSNGRFHNLNSSMEIKNFCETPTAEAWKPISRQDKERNSGDAHQS